MSQAIGEAFGHVARAALGHGPAVAEKVTPKAKHVDGSSMKATEWRGKHSVAVADRPRPAITDPEDVILRVTSTCICGSDLHTMTGHIPGMVSGDVMGHEFMGIVEETGPQVANVKTGDRVVVCFNIGCGSCAYCKRGLFSSCNSTNPSAVQEGMYGHRSGGFFGYSHLLGAYEGGQADFVRVPLANTNCLKIPAHDAKLPDERFVLLSDILPTAWHANELGEVGAHDHKNVAIWGCGPVGLLAAQCALYRGAENIVLIDRVPYRLEFAKRHLKGVKTIDFSKENVYETLHNMFPELGGPDVAIDCVGMHYNKTWTHTVEQKLGLETDTGDVINEIIRTVRKGGVISMVGAYGGYTNHFNIGGFMEKCLMMRAGQTPCQKYWPVLFPKVESGELDPSWVITHVLPLEQASHAYKIFDSKTDDCIKVVLKPSHARNEPAGLPPA